MVDVAQIRGIMRSFRSLDAPPVLYFVNVHRHSFAATWRNVGERHGEAAGFLVACKRLRGALKYRRMMRRRLKCGQHS